MNETIARIVDRAYREGRRSNGTDVARIRELVLEAQLDVEGVPHPTNARNPAPGVRMYAQVDHDVWHQENSNLRVHLLWLASRPGISLDDRRELAKRLQETLEAGGVLDDSSEEVEQALEDIRRTSEAVAEYVMGIVKSGIPENGLGETDPRRLPHYWPGRAENAVAQLRAAVEMLPDVRTIYGLRTVE